jgi:RNA polymerase sigma-70 factor (ECF subfamily)
MSDLPPSVQRVQAEIGRRGSAAGEIVAAAFEEHEGRLHGMLVATTRDPEVAADVTQEAFLRLLGEARAGRLPDNIGGWLYRTAMNLVASRARRAAVARKFAPRLVRHDSSFDPEGLAIEHERSRAMHAALSRLSLTERSALIMAAQGLTGEEIAEVVGKSHGATRTLMFRARTRLREALQSPELKS